MKEIMQYLITLNIIVKEILFSFVFVIFVDNMINAVELDDLIPHGNSR